MIDFKRLGERANREPPRVPGLTIAVTGHRPDKLWHRREQVGGVTVSHDGYEWGNPLRQRLRAEVRAATESLVAKAKRHRFDAGYRDGYLARVRWQNGWCDGEPGAERWRSIEFLTLSGGALGADQDAVGEWRRMGLPYVVVQPFPGQDSRWTKEARATYAKVLAAAAGVYCVSEHHRPSGGDDPRSLLLLRNEVMLCMADELIAVYDGSGGGTQHAVRWWDRAHCGAHMYRLDPREWRPNHER